MNHDLIVLAEKRKIVIFTAHVLEANHNLNKQRIWKSKKIKQFIALMIYMHLLLTHQCQMSNQCANKIKIIDCLKK